jgi:hypothetical protein
VTSHGRIAQHIPLEKQQTTIKAFHNTDMNASVDLHKEGGIFLSSFQVINPISRAESNEMRGVKNFE